MEENKEQEIQSSESVPQGNEASPAPIKKIIIIVAILLLVIGAGVYLLSNQSKKTTSLIQPTGTQSVAKGKNVLVVAQNIDEDGLEANTKEFQPFIDYLVSKLGKQGITKGKFIGTKSVSEMVELVREDQIDIAVDSAFPIYVVDNLTGAKPLVDRWKGGVGTYHTAIFVKKDSPIKTLDDLKGKMLAFDSTTSTVGYFLPKAELIKQGYKVIQKNNPTDSVAADEIGYTFVHGNIYDSVATGIVAAGAESELEINNYFGAKIKDYRIIATSPDILRFLVATRGNLDPELRVAIKAVLLAMDKTPEGKKILASFAETAKFTPVDNTDTAYGEIKQLTNFVQQEIISQ